MLCPHKFLLLAIDSVKRVVDPRLRLVDPLRTSAANYAIHAANS
jgi:hypothetical protein